MAKLQRPWNEVCSDLEVSLRGCNLSLQQISQATGVSYYAVHRFKRKGIANRSKNALALCTFFKIEVELQSEILPEDNEKLMQALRETWDGTPTQTELLARLILSTKAFTVQKRKVSKS